MSHAFEDTMNDELVAACIRGERKAQNTLYQKYSNAMYNVALRIMKDPEEAQDVLQLAFVDAFKNMCQYNNVATIGSWLKRIVVNRAISELRKKKMVTESWDNCLHDISEEHVDVDEQYLTVQRVQHAIKELSEGYRIVLNLYLIEGYDHGEIAEILGISVSTSKTQYHRAKQKLREKLSAKQLNYG